MKVNILKIKIFLCAVLATCSCDPSQARLDYECQTFNDCGIGERCYMESCIDDLRSPRGVVRETLFFGGAEFSRERIRYRGRVNLPTRFPIGCDELSVHYGYRKEWVPVNGRSCEFELPLSTSGTVLLTLKHGDREVFQTVFPCGYQKENLSGINFFSRNRIEFSVRESAAATLLLKSGVFFTTDEVVNDLLLSRIRELDSTKKFTEHLRERVKDNPYYIFESGAGLESGVEDVVEELRSILLTDSFRGSGETEDDAFRDGKSEGFCHIEKRGAEPECTVEEKDSLYITVDDQMRATNAKPRWVYLYQEDATLNPEPGQAVFPLAAIPPSSTIYPSVNRLLTSYLEGSGNNAGEKYLPLTIRQRLRNYLKGIDSSGYTISPVDTDLLELFPRAYLVSLVPGVDIMNFAPSYRRTFWATYIDRLFFPYLGLIADISGDPWADENGIGSNPILFLAERFERVEIDTELLQRDPVRFHGKVIGKLCSLLGGYEKETGRLYTALAKETESVEFGTVLRETVLRFCSLTEKSRLFYGEEFPSQIFNRNSSEDLYYYREVR